MASVRREDGLSKFQRHRAVQKANGLKLVRIWVPDPKAQGFDEEARRQAQVLVGASEEADVIDFIEQVAECDEADR